MAQDPYAKQREANRRQLGMGGGPGDNTIMGPTFTPLQQAPTGLGGLAAMVQAQRAGDLLPSRELSGVLSAPPELRAIMALRNLYGG